MAHSSLRLRLPQLASSVLVAAALVVAAPRQARAQLFPGDTLRLRRGDADVARGAFDHADTGAVYLRARVDSSALRVPYSSYSRADLLVGHRRATLRVLTRGAVRAGGLGAAIGLAGVLADPTNHGLERKVQGLVLGAAAGAVLGAGVAAIAPAAQEQEWREIDVRLLAGAPVGVTRDETAPRMAIATPTSTRTPGMVAAGDTVRLFLSRLESVHGILVRADSAWFFVNPLGAPDTVRLARQSVGRADVRRGERRRGANALMTGTLVGAAVGAGFVTAGIMANRPGDDGLGVIIGLFFGGVSVAAGTVVGGVVALTHTEQWIPFDPASLRMLPAVQ